jgi:putative transposase
MARKPRIEIEGGLYHILTRGNNRQLIFKAAEDYNKMLSRLAEVKRILPFYLYAYCLMPNHIHMLVERRDDAISRVMHRLLTGYSQFYNRKYRRVGHVFQGRYKAILCESDQYLAELVRYIHLNPVRAEMVRQPTSYIYSSHRAYVGLSKDDLVDTEPVLRYFGATKRVARERFKTFVRAGIKLGHVEEFYSTRDQGILGSEEFMENAVRRVGEIPRKAKPRFELRASIDSAEFINAAAVAVGMNAIEFCRNTKVRAVVEIKEAVILVGRNLGISNASLAAELGIHTSVVSRRFDSARNRMKVSSEFKKRVERIESSVLSRDKT